MISLSLGVSVEKKRKERRRKDRRERKKKYDGRNNKLIGSVFSVNISI
jgi:hypothetical protein